MSCFWGRRVQVEREARSVRGVPRQFWTWRKWARLGPEVDVTAWRGGGVVVVVHVLSRSHLPLLLFSRRPSLRIVPRPVPKTCRAQGKRTKRTDGAHNVQSYKSSYQELLKYVPYSRFDYSTFLMTWEARFEFRVL